MEPPHAPNQRRIAMKNQIYAPQGQVSVVHLLTHLILENAKSSPTDARVPNASLGTILPNVYHVSGLTVFCCCCTSSTKLYKCQYNNGYNNSSNNQTSLLQTQVLPRA